MKKKILNLIQSFIRAEEGQSTVEYILILAVVVMIATKFKKEIGVVIGNKVTSLGGDIQQFDANSP